MYLKQQWDHSKAGVIEQNAYALVNLMASYELNEHMTLQANGNLTNENIC